ncbi:GNAT family N-acetyltransferase [Radiobacillus sp. PE A8.2]|uniref:GNAT family N-acetyltransferase n=1 Tax=Radiobacillus sp. PE A8.2 TaxID=3380349 RepID=UPI00388DCC90
MEITIVETDKQKNDAYYVRNTVFVQEQNVPPELEIDDLEAEATHFVGYVDDQPIAAGRLRLVDDYGKLERICVLKEYRGLAYGQKLISAMEAHIQTSGYPKVKLNAQTHAENFYKFIGYETVSDQFMDAGIPHVTMIKQL